MKLSLTVNGESMSAEVDDDTPLLWVIRDHLKLTGTKFGCGIAQCGACTVYLNGSPTRSCVLPASAVEGQSITTIEGAVESGNAKEAQAITEAWEELAVVQCGYCQSGQIMSAAALLKDNPNPSDDAINDFMSGNICRCNTYVRIKKAIKLAANNLKAASADESLFYDASQVAQANNAVAGGTHHDA